MNRRLVSFFIISFACAFLSSGRAIAEVVDKIVVVVNSEIINF